MNWNIITLALAFGTTVMGGVGESFSFSQARAEAGEKVEFVCNTGYDPQSDRRLPTTFVFTNRGKIAVVRWETQKFPGFPPEKRCELVSRRFQAAYESGNLKLLTNGELNGQPVICAVSQYGEACQNANLLMTLRPEDDSFKILNELTNILDGRQRGPVKHSSGTPQAYYEIDIQNFLQTQPVEKE